MEVIDVAVSPVHQLFSYVKLYIELLPGPTI